MSFKQTNKKCTYLSLKRLANHELVDLGETISGTNKMTW